MIQSIDVVGSTGRMAGIEPAGSPYANGRGEAAVNAEQPKTGDQVAISPQGREFQTVREKVKDNKEIRETLVREMKKHLEKHPFPAGAVADIIAEKMINGWGALAQRR